MFVILFNDSYTQVNHLTINLVVKWWHCSTRAIDNIFSFEPLHENKGQNSIVVGLYLSTLRMDAELRDMRVIYY